MLHLNRKAEIQILSSATGPSTAAGRTNCKGLFSTDLDNIYGITRPPQSQRLRPSGAISRVANNMVEYVVERISGCAQAGE